MYLREMTICIDCIGLVLNLKPNYYKSAQSWLRQLTFCLRLLLFALSNWTMRRKLLRNPLEWLVNCFSTWKQVFRTFHTRALMLDLEEVKNWHQRKMTTWAGDCTEKGNKLDLLTNSLARSYFRMTSIFFSLVKGSSLQLCICLD